MNHKVTPNKKEIITSFIALTISVMIYFFDLKNTKPAICGGFGDCVKYTEMTLGFREKKVIKIEQPFNQRVLAPLLASRLSNDTTEGFKILNLISLITFIIFTFGITNSLKLDQSVSAITLTWFLSHPLGFRLYNVIPVSVDPLSYSLMACAIYLFLKNKPHLLAITIFLGLITKESFVFVVLLIIISCICEIIQIRKNKDFKLSLHSNDSRNINYPLLSSVTASLITYICFKILYLNEIFPKASSQEITIIGTLGYWINKAIKEPARIVTWIGAIFVSTGTFYVFISGLAKIKIEDLRSRNFIFFFLGTFGFFILGLVAGSDTSRIIFNGNTFIITFFLLIAQKSGAKFNNKLFVYASSFIVSLIYNHFFPTTFEYALYSENKVFEISLFVVAMLLTSASLFYLNFKNLKTLKYD